MNRASVRGLVILACLGIAACGPEGWEAEQQGWSKCPGGSAGSEEIQRLVRLARAGLLIPETSVEMCHWSKQALDAVIFITDEEDFSSQAVSFSPRGSYVLKNGDRWQYTPWD